MSEQTGKKRKKRKKKQTTTGAMAEIIDADCVVAVLIKTFKNLKLVQTVDVT